MLSRSNCTLLELKLLKHLSDLLKLSQFKLYLAGIETSIFFSWRLWTAGSNCTLLELKPYVIIPCDTFDVRSNCTLLELKHEKNQDHFLNRSFKLYLAGIETDGANGMARRAESSNCTLLELKPRRSRNSFCLRTCSNCTLLELKQIDLTHGLKDKAEFKLYLAGIETDVLPLHSHRP